MNWHYQLMYYKRNGMEDYYAVHEMYPSLNSWTDNPVKVVGNTPEEVVQQLKAMIADIEKHGVKDYE